MQMRCAGGLYATNPTNARKPLARKQLLRLFSLFGTDNAFPAAGGGAVPAASLTPAPGLDTVRPPHHAAPALARRRRRGCNRRKARIAARSTSSGRSALRIYDVPFFGLADVPFFGLASDLSRSRRRSRISRRHPTAWAYLRSVATVGECRRLPPPASSRATAGVLVPIRAATSACVSPACRRAFSNSSSKANSSAWVSYSALTAGRRSIFFTNSLCVSIRLHLFHPLAGDLEFPGRRLGR